VPGETVQDLCRLDIRALAYRINLDAGTVLAAVVLYAPDYRIGDIDG
jgi:hypothetical protein